MKMRVLFMMLCVTIAACNSNGGAAGADAASDNDTDAQLADTPAQDAAADAVAPADAAADVASSLKWFATCGDPACSSWHAKVGIADCATATTVGVSCSKADELCDPHNDCNGLLKCSDVDPRKGPGGCPISRRAWKSEITYLDDAARQLQAQQLLSTPLVRGDDGQLTLLGVTPPAEQMRDSMLDLYGALSASVATLQSQQQQLDALQAEVQKLKGDRR